jgi:hypothetical protein
MNSEMIHEQAGIYAATRWAELSTRAQDGGARALDAMWEYRSVMYGHIFTAAAADLARDRLEEAAEHYRRGEHEKAADRFFAALADAGLIADDPA